jgi:hypothetical protein
VYRQVIGHGPYVKDWMRTSGSSRAVAGGVDKFNPKPLAANRLLPSDIRQHFATSSAFFFSTLLRVSDSVFRLLLRTLPQSIIFVFVGTEEDTSELLDQ